MSGAAKLAVGVLWTAALCGAAGAGVPRENKEAGARRVYGYVTKVESNRITIMSLMGDVKTLPLVTEEDFTDKVAKGAKVTAWYFEGDTYTLRWLEYPLENSFTSSGSIRSRVRRAIILPNSSVPDADALYDAVAQVLETNLKWRFAPRALAEAVRRDNFEMASRADAVNSPNGQGNPAPIAQDERQLIPLIARKAKVNAVLEVDVVQVEANVRHSVAAWDGVEEPVRASKGLPESAKAVMVPQKDTVPAATVVFRLWDSRGKPMWSNRRGFALLALREGKELRERPVTEVFQNTDNVQAWLHMVFHSILPAHATGRP
jgi:hypothetical protein